MTHHPTARRALLLSLATAALLAGCQSPPPTENVPPPRIDLLGRGPLGDVPQTMLDWAGTYQAILPCNGCPGIAMSVQLRADQTAVVRERRLGGDAEPTPAQTYRGPFRFDPPAGSMVTLGQEAEPPAYRFFVAEGWIELRDRHTGAALTSTPAYRLRKTSLSQ